MDDPNITMEEYTRLEEEKARRRGRPFNWQTATFGKLENYEDEDDCFIDFETEFPTIVFDNTLIALQSEPTVFFVNDLKTDLENDNNEIPSSPNPTVDYFDDLDLFKDFEHEFLVIIYNDGQTSKLDYLTEPIVNPKHIDEFNLNDKTSLSEYDEENDSHFNDLFNINHPDDSKSIKDNDDNNIDIIQSSEDMAPLPAADQRHPWLRFQVKGYTKGIRHSYEQRLDMIWSRPVNRVYVLDFEGLTPEMRHDLAMRLRMVYTGGEGQQVFMSHAWRRLFGIQAPLVREFILEFLSTCRLSDTEMGLDVVDTLCFQLGGVRRRMTWRQFILALGLHTEQEMTKAGFRAYWAGSDRLIPDKGDLRDYWIEISSYAHDKVTDVDLFYLRSMDHGTTNVPHLLAQYLFRHDEGRKIRARLSGGHFIRHLAMHFGLVSDQGLRGLQGPERQQAAAAGAHEADKTGPAANEGAQDIPAPAQAPLPPPPAPQPRTTSQRIEMIEEEMRDLRHDVVGLRGVVESFTTEQS
ncbi:hypothetical protein Tco_0151806 [Tanacetum coccineum]